LLRANISLRKPTDVKKLAGIENSSMEGRSAMMHPESNPSIITRASTRCHTPYSINCVMRGFISLTAGRVRPYPVVKWSSTHPIEKIKTTVRAALFLVVLDFTPLSRSDEIWLFS